MRRNARAFGWDWFPLAATGGGVLALSTGGGVLVAAAASALFTAPHFVNAYRSRLRRVTWIGGDDVPRHTVRGQHAARTRIVSTQGGDWSLEVPSGGGITRVARPEADRLILPLLANVHQRGCTRQEVNDAVQELEVVGTGPAYIAHVADVYRSTRFGRLPRHTSLPLEMVSHEAEERRALAGELALLERAWREAEEIAAIADGLFG